MSHKSYLNHEIDYLKEVLEYTVKQYKYDFKHPKVISVSQKLDSLILKMMEQQKSTIIH